MNDKIIINTISNIYFIIVSFISFIFLTLSLVFIILLNGIEIQSIDLPSVKIKQLYIKWDEKINISVKDIQLLERNNKKSSLTYKNIKNFFKEAILFDNWIESVQIDKISNGDTNTSFSFHHTKGGYLNLISKEQILQSKIFVTNNLLKIKIEKFNDTKRNIILNGSIFIDKKMNIALGLSTNLNNNILLDINAFANHENLFYTLDSKKNVKNIEDIFKAFELPKHLRYWLLDAIDMSYVKLENAYGWIDYNDLENGYKNLHADLHLEKLNYSYDKKLDAIHTKHTKISFSKGIVYINPIDAYTYKQYLGTSHLNIDLTIPDTLLSLDLEFDGILNEDMLSLLRHYKIKVPFLQKNGLIKNNLNLLVNLSTLEVRAKGDFFTKKASFDYLGFNIDIFDTYMILDNQKIIIKDMLAKYKNIATAKVKAHYNAESSIGEIDFQLQKLALEDYSLSLLNTPSTLKYTMKPNHSEIKLAKSQWNFYDKTLFLKKLTLPIDLNKNLLQIPRTDLTVDKHASLTTSGNINLKTLKTALDINLKQFSFNTIKLAQDNLSFKISYDNKLYLDIDEESFFSVNDTNISLQKTSLNFQNNILKIKSHLQVENFAQADTYFRIDTKKKHGIISLEDTSINTTNHSLLSAKNRLDLNINYLNDILILQSKDIDFNFQLNKDKWMLNIASLHKVATYSEFLKQSRITKGRINLYKKLDKPFINYNASINFPYEVLVIDKIPMKNYELNGKYNTQTQEAKIGINNKVDITIKDNIDIKIKDLGVDIDKLLTALDTNSSSKQENSLDISLKATDSFLYISKERHIISDEISLEYKDNALQGKLKHQDGLAQIRYADNYFELYGYNFNSKFMEKLFALSKFRGGAFNFSISGTPKEYNGFFHIDDTTIKSYKILNNVLAFINTVPSLVTFSLPGYNRRGLKVEDAYMKFSAKDDIFNLSDISLNSEELKILGKGNASIKNNSIDLNLNLKTDLASEASKIPVVGYILFEKDAVSTSVEVKGKLDDPKVKSLLVKEIIVLPLNIIKRTLLYPFHLLSDINKTDVENMKELTENE